VKRAEVTSPLLTFVAGVVVIVLAVRAVLSGRTRRARRRARERMVWARAGAESTRAGMGQFGAPD